MVSYRWSFETITLSWFPNKYINLMTKAICIPSDVVDDGREVGGSVQLDGLQCLVVRL